MENYESVELLLSAARGIYIPRDAAEFLINNSWSGFDKDLLNDLQDPKSDYYWDSWQRVLDNAVYTTEAGREYRLHQDGDLFAYAPKYISEEEGINLFGE